MSCTEEELTQAFHLIISDEENSREEEKRSYQQNEINKCQEIFHCLTQIALMSDCANGMDCSSSSS
jgi:hypothetical protein